MTVGALLCKWFGHKVVHVTPRGRLIRHPVAVVSVWPTLVCSWRCFRCGAEVAEGGGK